MEGEVLAYETTRIVLAWVALHCGYERKVNAEMVNPSFFIRITFIVNSLFNAQFAGSFRRIKKLIIAYPNTITMDVKYT